MRVLEENGVKTFFGKWLIEGSPRVLLLDMKAANKFADEWKRKFESKTGIKLPQDDEMSNDALVFGYLTTWFLREVRGNVSFEICQGWIILTSSTVPRERDEKGRHRAIPRVAQWPRRLPCEGPAPLNGHHLYRSCYCSWPRSL